MESDVTAAEKEREDMRAELSELQALERALETYGAAAAGFAVNAQSEELQSVHAEAAAKAFADCDVNKDGLLERNELAFMSAEMGAPMDAKQLDATLRALNPSATGKVTPAEWRAFWFGAPPAAGGHQELGLALLRARLFQHKGLKLVAAIGKRKGVHFPDAHALDVTDAKTHVWELSVGEFDAAKATAQYRAHHNLILDPAMLDADRKYSVFYSFDLKTTGKPDFAPYLTQMFRDICNASAHAIAANVTAPRKDVVRISIGIPVPFPAEPSAALEQFGLNAELLARVPRFDFELGHTPADVFGAGKFTVADVLKVRARAHLHIENALVASGTAGLRAQVGNRDAQELADVMPFFGAVESVVRIGAGDVSDVVNALSEYMRTKFGEQSRQMKDLKHFTTLIQEMVTAAIRKECQRDRRREFPIALSCFKAALLTFERDIVELSQLSVWLRSGLGATAELDGVVTARDAMAAINFVEAAAQEVYANPQNAAPPLKQI